MLKERVITALVMLSVLGLALFVLPPIGFAVFLAVAIGVAAWEWADLSGLKSPAMRVVYALAIVGLGVFISHYLNLLEFSQGKKSLAVFKQAFHRDEALTLKSLMGAAGIFWSVALLWVLGFPASAAIWGSTVVRLVMGVITLMPAGVAMLAVYEYGVSKHDGPWHFLYVLGIVICADTGAYFVGKAFGKHKLAPKVSPGKSWEGFVGGLISCLVFAWVVGTQYTTMFNKSILGLTLEQLMVATVIAALASVLGDLLESMVKRHRGIKDSSQLLPGHGGVMDRLDSLAAAAPVFLLMAILLAAR